MLWIKLIKFKTRTGTPAEGTTLAGGSGITTTGDTDATPDPTTTDLHPTTSDLRPSSTDLRPLATRLTTRLPHTAQHRYGQAGTDNPYARVLYTEKTVHIARVGDGRLCLFF